MIIDTNAVPERTQSAILDMWNNVASGKRRYHDLAHFISGSLTERLRLSFPCQVLDSVIDNNDITGDVRYICMRPAIPVVANLEEKMRSIMHALNTALNRQLVWRLMGSLGPSTCKIDHDFSVFLQREVCALFVERFPEYEHAHVYASADKLSGWPESWTIQADSQLPEETVVSDRLVIVPKSAQAPSIGKCWLSAVKIGAPPIGMPDDMQDVRVFEFKGLTHVEFPFYLEWKMALTSDRYLYVNKL